MNRWLPLLIGIVVWTSLGSPSTAAAAPSIVSGEFVHTSGRSFVLGATPFVFLGANASLIHGPRERAAYIETLDALASDGLSVVRIWALGEAAADAPGWQDNYAFRRGPEGWIVTSFEHLDRVIDACRQRNLRVILVLANRWQDYGGVPMYLRWSAGGGVVAEADVSQAEVNTEEQSNLFWSCDACKMSYQTHVRALVERVNTINQMAYRDDPTIFSWELINEGSATTTSAVRAQKQWTEEMAKFVHSLDANHLVGAGHIGYRLSRERRAWFDVQRIAEIDYFDAHAYPHKRELKSRRNLRKWVDDRLLLARAAGAKPFVWGEFGFDDGPKPSAHDSEWTRSFLQQSFASGAAGALIWIYEPSESARHRRHAITVQRRSTPIRSVLRQFARQLAAARQLALDSNSASEDFPAPSYVQRTRANGHPARARWQNISTTAAELSFSPFAFRQAEFEALGAVLSPTPHVWGAGRGWVRFNIAPLGRPQKQLTSLSIYLKASSELSGKGVGRDPADTSLVTVHLDGVYVGEFVAAPDDGQGEAVVVTTTAPEVLARFASSRRHTLEFSASEGDGGVGGLCVYEMPVDADLLGGIRMEVTWAQ